MREGELQIARAEIIRASAGSGKTYVLVQRYIALLLHGESPRTILASTFTVRAAGEVRERVLRRLAMAVLDEQVLAQLEQEYNRKITQPQIAEVLRRAISELPGAAICTLDALVARIAGGLTVDCGLPLGWRLSELPGLSRELEAELVALQARQLGKLLGLVARSDASRKIAQPLIELCLRFYEHLQVYGPATFTIGAVCKDLPPIRSWAEGVASMPLPLTKAGTPRAHFVRAIEKLRNGLERGDPSNLFSLELIQRALIRDRFDREDLSSATYKPLWELAERLQRFEFNRIVERSEVILMVLAGFDELYRKEQVATGLLKHSDLLLAVARFMADDVLAGVAYALDQRFSHILLDEFQDTSPLQWRVLRPFVAEVVSDQSRNRSVFIVGDPKQAIYGWRGGSAAIFDQVTDEMKSDWTAKSLAESFRSSQVVLDFVNRVFENLKPIKEEYLSVVQRFSENFKPHFARKKIDGRVTLTLADPGSNGAARWVVGELKRIFASNPDAEVGILTRRNDTVVTLIRELRLAGIPAVGDGRAGSERTLPVEALKALLHYSLHPADTRARYQVQISGILDAGEKIEEVAASVTTPAIIRRMVGLLERGVYNPEQVRDIELALIALGDGVERRVGARELLAMLQNQPLPGGQGQVAVMTMHRAKGLEFEYVLLPELDPKLIRTVPPDALTWREDDGSWKTVPYINETLQRVDPRFEMADERMRTEEYYEALCLLYVAVTRAVKELHLFASTNSSNSSFSMIGVIAAALGIDLATSGVAYDSASLNSGE